MEKQLFHYTKFLYVKKTKKTFFGSARLSRTTFFSPNVSLLLLDHCLWEVSTINICTKMKHVPRLHVNMHRFTVTQSNFLYRMITKYNFVKKKITCWVNFSFILFFKSTFKNWWKAKLICCKAVLSYNNNKNNLFTIWTAIRQSTCKYKRYWQREVNLLQQR